MRPASVVDRASERASDEATIRSDSTGTGASIFEITFPLAVAMAAGLVVAVVVVVVAAALAVVRLPMPMLLSILVYTCAHSVDSLRFINRCFYLFLLSRYLSFHPWLSDPFMRRRLVRILCGT